MSYITITVLYFGAVKEATGRKSESITLEAGATGSDLLKAVGLAYPRIAEHLQSCITAIDDAYCDLAAAIPDGATVAVIPPVSGG